MFKHCITLLSLGTLLVGQPREINFGGGPHQREYSTGLKCISEEERTFVREHRIEIDHESMRDTVLFQDPMGNGGMMNLNDSVRHHIWNFVDQNSAVGWILDYNCSFVTYDGHQGTDVAIGGFYYMDEMETPIVAAAPGIVTYTHDGEFDRRTSWINGAVANGVIVSHSDGTSAWYWHMKTNSVAVATGDTIETGDTLGFVGSSGVSNTAHLHFEVEGAAGYFKDPWEGQCGDGPSRWVDQLPFIGDTNIYGPNLLNHLTTSYPVNNDNEIFNYIFSENVPDITHINPGEFYLSGGWFRNLYNTDTLKIRWYRNGEFDEEFSWVPGNTNYWYSGYEFYTTSFWYSWGFWDNDEGALGEWTEKTYINSDLLAVKTYVCDDIPNQSPSVDFQQISVELGETITGEFTATDDGNPFWFNLDNEPNNGGRIELYGGRRRKFQYTAPMDFTGFDVAGISATDDRGETGGMTFIIFEVSGSGLTNLMVEPSYVSPLQDSVIISAEILGEVDEPSILAYINNINNGEQVEVELVESDGIWSAYWAPETESFFNVDLQMIHGADSDTVFYEDIGSFTSVGPLNVTMIGDLTVSPGGSAVLNFVLENSSATQSVSDVSLFFEAENMECLQGISEDTYYFGDIAPSDSADSEGYFFIASLNDDCGSGSTILINAQIYSGEDLYWVDDFTIQIETLGIGDDNVPAFYSLGEAYPNPFNPDTRIKYGLTQDGYVSFMVHDLMGRKVKSLVSSEKDAGYHSIRWDATNDFGESVSAGMYFYTIQAGEFRHSKKMILLK